MIHLNNVKYMAGGDVTVCPALPYNDTAVEFLDCLSKSLMKYREYPDIVSFGFYIRKANILRLKENFEDKHYRIGRGLIFHIAPSNVPINFAYSFLFGLLSGNTNIVKISSKEYEQVNIVCSEIEQLFQEEKFKQIKDTNAFIRYSNIDEITAYISSISDGRVIWGGDKSITHIRKFPIKIRGVEIVFADRYSICILNSDAVLDLNDSELQKLSDKFYNDTYLFDQNACSSPQIIFWYGKNIEKAKNIFWNSIKHSAAKYDLAPIKVVDKYTDMLANIIQDNVKKVEMYGNEIYCLETEKIQDNLNGRFGLFYEYSIEELSEIADTIRDKCQTITYFGIDKNKIISSLINKNISGVDRIVPVGMALDMNVIWDGYDIVKELSRVIDII